jgi:hypothetical protein
MSRLLLCPVRPFLVLAMLSIVSLAFAPIAWADTVIEDPFAEATPIETSGIEDGESVCSLEFSLYFDANNDGIFDADENWFQEEGQVPEFNFEVEVERASDSSIWSQSFTLDNFGTYSLSVPVGTCSLEQHGSDMYWFGKPNAPGSAGGVSTEDGFIDIDLESLGPDEEATGYNFGICAIRAEYVSKSLLIRTVPEPSTILSLGFLLATALIWIRRR